MAESNKKLKFSFQGKLVSINKTYYANKRHGMRPEAKELQYKIFHAINENKEEFAKLRFQFEASKHGYKLSITSYLVGLYNKQGLPNSHSCDLTNTEKLVADCIMLPKFYGTNVPYSAPNLNIDDKWLVELHSSKLPSNTIDYVEIELEIVDLPKL